MLAALVAEGVASDARAALPAAPGIAALGDISGFVTPGDSAELAVPVTPELRADPFEAGRAGFPVASGQRAPTVNASGAGAGGGGGRQLTAILIADDRPVAVIDGAVVNVGDVLPDGARVATIGVDRVALVERSGRFRVLTISAGRR